MKKLIFHIHSNYSYDCNVDPKKIVDLAIAHEYNYLVITDHDSINGSVHARDYAARNNFNIEIPISAEYLTDIGDIVVVNLPKNFQKIFNYKKLCRTVKNLGGYVILPHPFKGHKLNNIEFTYIDYVEIFNSRCSIQENEKAILFAKSINSKFIYASDAHLLSEIDNVISIYYNNPFEEELIPLKLSYTSKNKIYYSQLIKVRKKRNFTILKNYLWNILKSIIKFINL